MRVCRRASPPAPARAYVRARGHVGRRRGGACGTRGGAAAMAAVSRSVRLQRCVVSPAGRHSASLIFLHGSGGSQFYVLVSCPLGTPSPRSPHPAPQCCPRRSQRQARLSHRARRTRRGRLPLGSSASVDTRAAWSPGPRGPPFAFLFSLLGFPGPASWLPA